jgi:hypothetical protein
MNAKEFLINEGVDGFFDVKLRAKEIEPLLEQYADHKTEELKQENEELREFISNIFKGHTAYDYLHNIESDVVEFMKKYGVDIGRMKD